MKKLIEPYMERHIQRKIYKGKPAYESLITKDGTLLIPRLFAMGLNFENPSDVLDKIKILTTGVYWVLNDEYIQYLIVVGGESLESLVFHKSGTVHIHEYGNDGKICCFSSEPYKKRSTTVTVKCRGGELQTLINSLNSIGLEFKVD